MLRFLRKLTLTVVTALSLLLPMAAPAVVFAQADIKSNLDCGASLQLDSTADCSTAGGTDRIQGIIETAINLMSVIISIVAVIMIIVGGFKYITSGGDSGNVSSAKNTIIYAVIGLIIVALAQFFVQFVLNRVNT